MDVGKSAPQPPEPLQLRPQPALLELRPVAAVVRRVLYGEGGKLGV